MQALCFRGRMISGWPSLSDTQDNCSRLGLHGVRMLVMKCFHSSTLIILLHYRAFPQGLSKKSQLSSSPAETKTRPPNKLHLLKILLPPCSEGAWSCSSAWVRSGRAMPAPLWLYQPANPRQRKQWACGQPGVTEAETIPELTMQAPDLPQHASNTVSATLPLLLTGKDWTLTASWEETALSLWLLNSLLFLPILINPWPSLLWNSKQSSTGAGCSEWSPQCLW